MNELPPEAAGLLEQARRADREHRVDLEESLAGLHASIGLAAVDLPEPPADAVPSSASQAPQATLAAFRAGALFGSKAAKLFLATAVLGALGGGALWSARPQPLASPPALAPRSADALVPARGAEDGEHAQASAAAGAPQAGASSAPVVALAQPAERAAPHSGRSSARSERARGSVARALPKVAAEGGPPARAGAALESVERAAPKVEADRSAPSEAGGAERSRPATPASAQDEIDLIDAVLTSLRDRDAARALSLLEAHGARHPNGKFATERQGLRVLALCALGRVEEGRVARHAFLRAAPGAPIAARVAAACDEGAAQR